MKTSKREHFCHPKTKTAAKNNSMFFERQMNLLFWEKKNPPPDPVSSGAVAVCSWRLFLLWTQECILEAVFT